MIRYSLKCAAGHVFDSWFRDSAAFDALAGAGRIACAVCGEPRVEKAIMAPALAGTERADPATASPAAAPAPEVPAAISAAATPAERALAKLRRYLSEKADYVGRGFADEVRRIHIGEAEDRSIWGEATPEDAKALSEEGIPVVPLPPLIRRND